MILDSLCIRPARRLAFVVTGLFITSGVWGQEALSTDSVLVSKDVRGAMAAAAEPNIQSEIHMNGRFWVTLNNNGIFGNVYGYELPGWHKTAPSFYYPKYSRIQHGYQAGLWIGGVLGRDTLVTTAIDESYNVEFWPDLYPGGEFEKISNDPTSLFYNQHADAELQFRAVYRDTFTDQPWVPISEWDGRKHQPLGLEVIQNSYSWSYSYAEDILIVDYVINNIGRDTIKSAWAGIYYNGCIHHRSELPWPIPDDLAGYLASAPHDFEELGEEPLRIAYIMDSDGYSGQLSWDLGRSSTVFGIAPLRVPLGAYVNNFNWWNGSLPSYNTWGPRLDDRYLRTFPGGLGDPFGDKNKYYLMSKPEIDYPGLFSAVDHTGEGWLEPPYDGYRFAYGHQPVFVTSFGPFRLDPFVPETLTVVFAVGEDLHTVPDARRELFDPYSPQAFYNYLDFDDIISNVRWAKLIYDNPGTDTDNDGDSGRFFAYYDQDIEETVKVYYEGDGVPDFRGASPPPPPSIRVHTEDGRIVLRWNGYNVENAIDPMTFAKDFEGYRVYLARSPEDGEAVLLASWDHEDYSRYHWNIERGRWENKLVPFTAMALRELYGESFEPLSYTRANPFNYRGESYFFEPVDFNASDHLDLKGIHKRYPDAVLDTSDVDKDGNMRYFEWEYAIEDLLPSVPYWVSVTAFDYGHAPKSLEPLESSVSANTLEVVPLRRGDDVLRDGQLDVYCYPNPYRSDGGYFEYGFENRGNELATDRSHTIYFANLPNRCQISIYSLDGDLIRSMEHDEPSESGTASVHRWNMVTRNTEAVQTGLYFWVVESEYGQQIGKLVIMK